MNMNEQREWKWTSVVLISSRSDNDILVENSQPVNLQKPYIKKKYVRFISWWYNV